MSFIIKGLDIPKTCRQCPCCADNGLVGMQRDYYCVALDCAPSIDELDQKLTDCPLVEIPTPHGRLIDADELFCKIDGIEGWDYGDESDMAISAAEALSAIDDSPTVIEVEVSE